jgi:hypothetical protein
VLHRKVTPQLLQDKKTLGLKSGGARPIRRSSRLLATFKEPNLTKKIPTVNLTCDGGQPTMTAGVVVHELATTGVVIREPARIAGVVICEPSRRSERVLVPTVEKGIQRIEAKKKGKRPAWQP